MSFLDSLENNLKALESREEKDPETLRREREQREADRAAALGRAPYTEALRKSAFTSELLTQCRTIGHGQRVLVQFTWLGETLRLDAKAKRLELRPTAAGIEAHYFVDGEESGCAMVDLSSSAEALARDWLAPA
ncbi:MAG: hypothetical protein ACK58M_23915 [Acidobacteriota bacterium]|nr:hypothetical protein [Bryobacteraceae bacterium CoA2 C42]MCA2963216.1 hypothetical protein [Acidobacteriaceae bacterium]